MVWCLREKLVKIAGNFEMEVGDRFLKKNMKNNLKENVFELGVLQSKVHAVGSGLDTINAAGIVGAVVSTGLTFEQHRKLLLLQMEI